MPAKSEPIKVELNTAGQVSADSGEAELLSRLRAGDSAAFETLVMEQGGRMLSVAHRFLSHEQDAADAVQDALLSAFKAIGSFKGEAKLGTWLHRILVNACLMRRRLQDRQSTETIDSFLPQFDSTGHHAERVPRFELSPSEVLVNKELRQHIRDCIDALPADYREILILRDIEEMDTESAAKILNVSLAVVKTRLHRARQALRALLIPFQQRK